MLKGDEILELSTQLIIKEALLRGVKVEVLDGEDNLIRLTRGKKIVQGEIALILRMFYMRDIRNWLFVLQVL